MPILVDYDDLLCGKKNLVVAASWNLDDVISSCRAYRVLQPIMMSYPILVPSSDELVKVFNEK